MRKRVINYYPANKKRKKNPSDENQFSNRIFFSLILILICFTLIFTISQIVTSNSLMKIKKVRVKTGDSLWKIATEHYSTKIDIRKKIYQIRRINKLSSVKLHPGQIIKIPKT